MCCIFIYIDMYIYIYIYIYILCRCNVYIYIYIQFVFMYRYPTCYSIWLGLTDRSSHPEVFLQACNFIKMKLQHTQVFPSEIYKMFRSTCFEEHLRTAASGLTFHSSLQNSFFVLNLLETKLLDLWPGTSTKYFSLEFICKLFVI